MPNRTQRRHAQPHADQVAVLARLLNAHPRMIDAPKLRERA